MLASCPYKHYHDIVATCFLLVCKAEASTWRSCTHLQAFFFQTTYISISKVISYTIYPLEVVNSTLRVKAPQVELLCSFKIIQSNEDSDGVDRERHRGGDEEGEVTVLLSDRGVSVSHHLTGFYCFTGAAASGLLTVFFSVSASRMKTLLMFYWRF